VTVVEQDRAIADPIGLITDLVAAAEPHLALDRISSVVVALAGGRAKSRRLAAALAARPGVLPRRCPVPCVGAHLVPSGDDIPQMMPRRAVIQDHVAGAEQDRHCQKHQLNLRP
jgi:hypothetical protein